MSVMVSGGGGLIGSRIVRKLLARGDRVISLDASADQPRLAVHEEAPQLERVACDVRDYDRLLACMREFAVERVIHMAAVLAPVTEDEPAIGFAVNIGGTTNVLEAARHSGVKRVISAAAVGEAAVSDVAATQLSPVIHADDVAEIMTRICFAENLQLPVYCGLNVQATVQHT